MEQIEIYDKLMRKWESTGYIGKVFCNYRTHAKKVAWAASISIYKNNNKIRTNTLSLPREGTEPFSGNGQCVQLALFSIK